MAEPEPTRWSIDAANGAIIWNVADRDNPANTLPHSDHVEMSGRRVSVIIRYRVDEHRRLSIERDIFFPQRRVRENDVRGYLRRIYSDPAILPHFEINGTQWFPQDSTVDRITFDGTLVFQYQPTSDGVIVQRALFPSSKQSQVCETWRFFHLQPGMMLTATCDGQTEEVTILPRQVRSGRNLGENDYEDFFVGVWSDEMSDHTIPSRAGWMVGDDAVSVLNDHLEKGIAPSFGVCYEAISEFWFQNKFHPDCTVDETARKNFTRNIRTDPDYIEFICPDSELNQLFSFCKLRAAESLFETDLMGLVHSPGGGNYYCGIWANDQCEYSGPFFAFLNDGDAHEAAINAYRYYAKHMGPDYAPVPTSFEMGGNIPYRAGGDRGDAAMIASGLARYLLVRGSHKLAAELYPALQWCNEYNRRKTDVRGVVLSDTDELEGRFLTGDANLSTASLAYDGYRMSGQVARELGHQRDADDWNHRAEALADAIETHFGATVEGYETYRYYDGNDVLRSWICLPLVFGLAQGERKAGTIDALFSPRLWTPDGLATQAGDTTFWDRSTLYGLRGAFIAGATEPAYAHLLAYSRRRLLGDHVPYPVEAYPENAQAHLSAESALYCRVILEGLLGIVPTGFASFTITPRLPNAWNEYRIRFTAFGNRDIAIHVERIEGQVAVHVSIRDPNHPFAYDAVGSEQETHRIVFDNTL